MAGAPGLGVGEPLGFGHGARLSSGSTPSALTFEGVGGTDVRGTMSRECLPATARAWHVSRIACMSSLKDGLTWKSGIDRRFARRDSTSRIGWRGTKLDARSIGSGHAVWPTLARTRSTWVMAAFMM